MQALAARRTIDLMSQIVSESVRLCQSEVNAVRIGLPAVCLKATVVIGWLQGVRSHVAFGAECAALWME